MKNHFVDVLPPNHYLFYLYLFMYENNQYPKHYWIQFSKYCVSGRDAPSSSWVILFYMIQWCRCMYHHRLLNDVWFVMIANFSRPRGVHAVTTTITTRLNWSKANNLWPPNNPTMGNIFTKLHDATQDSARERYSYDSSYAVWHWGARVA